MVWLLLSVIGLQMVEAPGYGEISVKDHAITIHLSTSTISNSLLVLMNQTQTQNQLQIIENLFMAESVQHDLMSIALVVIVTGPGLLMIQRNGIPLMPHVDAKLMISRTLMRMTMMMKRRKRTTLMMRIRMMISKMKTTRMKTTWMTMTKILMSKMTTTKEKTTWMTKIRMTTTRMKMKWMTKIKMTKIKMTITRMKMTWTMMIRMKMIWTTMMRMTMIRIMRTKMMIQNQLKCSLSMVNNVNLNLKVTVMDSVTVIGLGLSSIMVNLSLDFHNVDANMMINTNLILRMMTKMDKVEMEFGLDSIGQTVTRTLKSQMVMFMVSQKVLPEESRQDKT